MGDRSRSARSLCRFGAHLGAATTEDEGFELVMSRQPDLICSSVWKSAMASICSSGQDGAADVFVVDRSGSGDSQVVQEALDCFANGVIFNQPRQWPWRPDFSVADHRRRRDLPRAGATSGVVPQKPKERLDLVENHAAELEVVAQVARGLKNNVIADVLGVSLEWSKPASVTPWTSWPPEIAPRWPLPPCARPD